MEKRRRRGQLASQQHSYVPYGKAAELIACTLPEILISGPAGTGKSRACLEKIHSLMLQYPGARALIVRKTRESLTESALFTYEQWVLGPGHPLTHGPQRRNRQVYPYPNGSRVVVGGLDKPSKIMSTEFDLIYVQEAIELAENDWESLTTRLRNGVVPYQQLLADTNPDRPTHWLKLRCDSGRTVMLDSRHEDNPRLWDGQGWTPEGEKYIARLDALTGVRLQRLRHGKWVQAEGVIYDGWDAEVHLIDRFDIPREWRRFRAIDFGFTNPFVCQWWAVDPDGRLYRYREIYMTQRLVEDHARQIKALSEGERIEATVADHDAEDMATLRRHGIPTTPARKAVKGGLQAVAERLRKVDDGRPRIYFLRGGLVEVDQALIEAKKPTCTEQEFDGYVWAPAADGKPVKEEPVKLDDHGMDTTRYAVMYANRPIVRPKSYQG